MIVGFFSHFLILILHALLSLRPLQCGSGSHKSQVFWQFCFFFGLYVLHCLFLHVSPGLSVHASGLGGGDDDGGDGESDGVSGNGEGGDGLGDRCSPRAVGAPHLIARADSNGELGLGEEVQGMRG